jgi:hypothetical protein
MRAITMSFLFLTIFPSIVFAGEIFGIITFQDMRPVGEGVVLELLWGNNRYYGYTDRFGSYRIPMPETGTAMQCPIQGNYRGVLIQPFIILVNPGSTRCDLFLQYIDGRYLLNRR